MGPFKPWFLPQSKNGCRRLSIGGPPLPASDDCTALAAAHALDVTGGMLDANPDLSICPEASQSFPGQPGLICRDALGRVLRPEFRFVKDLAQGQNLCLTYADDRFGPDL